MGATTSMETVSATLFTGTCWRAASLPTTTACWRFAVMVTVRFGDGSFGMPLRVPVATSSSRPLGKVPAVTANSSPLVELDCSSTTLLWRV